MAKIDYRQVLKCISSLFNINLNSDTGESVLFERLAQVIEFDYAGIYFLNPESAQLKYTSEKKLEMDSIFRLNNEIKKELYSEKGYVLSSSSRITKVLKLEYKSLVLEKLIVGQTVYGFIVLGSKQSGFYNEDDSIVLQACANILAYVIKDVELSNVFKLQLKALKDGIVEKNNAYKMIKAQNEKILESEKIKMEFLANVSHELRTPLNAILGFSEILSTCAIGDLNEKQQEFVSDIRVSGLHLLGMVNEILDMSKIESNTVKLVCTDFFITRALSEVANILKPLAKQKNVRLIIDYEEDFEVYADYQKLQQILYNLVSNAIKYSPNDDEVVISAFKTKSNFELKVHDNGIGIDKKYHGKIFAKFVQLDSAYTKKESSTGLGLTITKELTELHGGKVSVISEVNNGSTFVVRLPLKKIKGAI